MLSSKFQLNSGAIPEEIYNLYHSAAKVYKQPIAIEVAEAVKAYAPVLAMKLSQCLSCLKPLPESLSPEEREDIMYCPYCGKSYCHSEKEA